MCFFTWSCNGMYFSFLFCIMWFVVHVMSVSVVEYDAKF